MLDHNPKTCNVAISLMQKHAEHVQGDKNLRIGFFITTVSTVRYHVGTMVLCVVCFTCVWECKAELPFGLLKTQYVV